MGCHLRGQLETVAENEVRCEKLLLEIRVLSRPLVEKIQVGDGRFGRFEGFY